MMGYVGNVYHYTDERIRDACIDQHTERVWCRIRGDKSEAEVCGLDTGASANMIEEVDAEPRQSMSAVLMHQVENRTKASDIPGQATTVSLTSNVISMNVSPVPCRDCSVSEDCNPSVMRHVHQ
jgi:hypothetical protein